MSCHRPPSVTGPAEARALRAIWCAVLVQAFRDIVINSGSAELNRYQVERWVGSRDFRLVCELAGVDPGRAERVAREQIEQQRAGAADVPNMKRGKRQQQHIEEAAA